MVKQMDLGGRPPGAPFLVWQLKKNGPNWSKPQFPLHAGLTEEPLGRGLTVFKRVGPVGRHQFQSCD
jgi:hypothetical protein